MFWLKLFTPAAMQICDGDTGKNTFLERFWQDTLKALDRNGESHLLEEELHFRVSVEQMEAPFWRREQQLPH